MCFKKVVGGESVCCFVYTEDVNILHAGVVSRLSCADLFSLIFIFKKYFNYDFMELVLILLGFETASLLII